MSGFLHNVPGSLQSAGHGILGIPKMAWDTAGDIGTSLSDGVDSAYNRAYGDKNIADADDKEAARLDANTREKLLNLVPFGGSHGGIAHYAEAAGDWATSLSLPPDQAAMMRQEGGAALHRANQYMEDMAYQDPAGFALNVLPLAAVGRIGKLADGAEAGAREAAAAGDTAKAARLSEQASRYHQAISLTRGGKVGAAARDAKAAAAEKLSAKSKATVAKGKAAVAKHRERQAAGRRDPNDPLSLHTDASRAKAKADEARMHGRWQQQGRGAGQGQGPALAHASDTPSSNHTPAIGKPESNPGMMQMAGRTGIPLVRAVLGPTRRIRLRGALRTRMLALLQRRQRAALLRDRLQAEEAHRPLTPAESNQLTRARHDVNEASRQLGERASEHYVKSRYPNAYQVYPAPGAPSRSGDFDQVWQVPGGGAAGPLPPSAGLDALAALAGSLTRPLPPLRARFSAANAALRSLCRSASSGNECLAVPGNIRDERAGRSAALVRHPEPIL